MPRRNRLDPQHRTSDRGLRYLLLESRGDEHVVTLDGTIRRKARDIRNGNADVA